MATLWPTIQSHAASFSREQSGLLRGHGGHMAEALVLTSRPPPARYTSCSRLGLGDELQPCHQLRRVNQRTDGDDKTVQHHQLVAPSWAHGQSGLPAREPGKPPHLQRQEGGATQVQQRKPIPGPPACHRFVMVSTETRDFFHFPLKNNWQMFQLALLQLRFWNEREVRPFLGLDGQMEKPCSPCPDCVLSSFPRSLFT